MCVCVCEIEASLDQSVVLCSGGSQAFDRWEVDNAFITLHGGDGSRLTPRVRGLAVHASYQLYGLLGTKNDYFILLHVIL